MKFAHIRMQVGPLTCGSVDVASKHGGIQPREKLVYLNFVQGVYRASDQGAPEGTSSIMEETTSSCKLRRAFE